MYTGRTLLSPPNIGGRSKRPCWKTMFSKGTEILNEFPVPRKEVVWDYPIHISLKLLRTFLYSWAVILFPVVQLSLAGWHRPQWRVGVGDNSRQRGRSVELPSSPPSVGLLSVASVWQVVSGCQVRRGRYSSPQRSPYLSELGDIRFGVAEVPRVWSVKPEEGSYMSELLCKTQVTSSEDSFNLTRLL
jgi:hypothetical protein